LTFDFARETQKKGNLENVLLTELVSFSSLAGIEMTLRARGGAVTLLTPSHETAIAVSIFLWEQYAKHDTAKRTYTASF